MRDPFGENTQRAWRWRTHVLGTPFEFTGNHRALHALVRDAFADVPRHRIAGACPSRLRVHLHASPGGAVARGLPPAPVLSSGAGLLGAHVDAENFVVMDPASGRAFIRLNDRMLAQPRLARYELVEFAAITLATRARGFIALHAGCVGAHGRGVLLLGESGAGKSTLALHAARCGLDFLAEDSVFVAPASLDATGLPAFVHASEAGLALVADRRWRAALQRAPVIERRSGVRKRELDLRHGLARLAPRPLRIVATVVLTARRRRGPARSGELSTRELRRILRAGQPYAVRQPGWREFERRALRAGGFRLDRMPPDDGVARLREILAEHRS